MAARAKKANGRKRRPRSDRMQWSREQLDTADQLIAAGCNVATLARALNVSRSTAVRYFGDRIKAVADSGEAPERLAFLETERALVQLSAGVGIPHASIASQLGMSVGKFQSEFAAELASAKDAVDQAVATAIVKFGLRGDGNLLKFYARSKMGWNDKLPLAPNAPPPPSAEDQLRKAIGELSPEGQAKLDDVLDEMGAASAISDDGPGPEDTLQ